MQPSLHPSRLHKPVNGWSATRFTIQLFQLIHPLDNGQPLPQSVAQDSLAPVVLTVISQLL